MLSKTVINKDFLSYIFDLKQKYGFRIIDTHVHPFEVMGVAHIEDYRETKPGELQYKEVLVKEINHFSPGLLEKMEFNRIANFLSNIAFTYFPKYVSNEIKSAFNKVGEKRILGEMDKALIDEVVLLPVEPWATTSQVNKYFNNKKLLLLGSLNIQQVEIHNINKIIKSYIDDIKIIGLKFHPNIQNFKPQPSQNSREIEEKLKLIYKVAEENNLYMLFHGGPSAFTKRPDEKYGRLERHKDNALLENFCDSKGKSELLGKYDIPIIIAHLGHFGLNKINSKLVKTIVNKYHNVYFDTAGVSPKCIQKFIELAGSKRIILGSDAMYFKMIYSIYFVYKSAQRANTKESLDEIMSNILGRNFKSKIIKRRKDG